MTVQTEIEKRLEHVVSVPFPATDLEVVGVILQIDAVAVTRIVLPFAVPAISVRPDDDSPAVTFAIFRLTDIGSTVATIKARKLIGPQAVRRVFVGWSVKREIAIINRIPAAVVTSPVSGLLIPRQGSDVVITARTI